MNGTYSWIGWLATAGTAASYWTRHPVTLRRVQGVAALLWGVYGALIHSLPVLVANVIVATMAFWSSFRKPAAVVREP